MAINNVQSRVHGWGQVLTSLFTHLMFPFNLLLQNSGNPQRIGLNWAAKEFVPPPPPFSTALLSTRVSSRSPHFPLYSPSFPFIPAWEPKPSPPSFSLNFPRGWPSKKPLSLLSPQRGFAASLFFGVETGRSFPRVSLHSPSPPR